MTERYCFVCDAAVEDEVCRTCGTTTWLPSSGPTPTRADEHLREIAAKKELARSEPQPAVAPPPTLPPPPAPKQPERALEDRSFTRVKAPGRWAPIAAVVVAGIVLMSVLAGPSGNAPDNSEVETPTITAHTTTTVPAPGSLRSMWAPAPGTWVGGFPFLPNRPEVLYGPSLTTGLLYISPDTSIIDALPDGRLVGWDSETGEILLIGGTPDLTPEPAPLPEPGPDGMAPRLSPDGSRLALIDRSGAPHVWEIGSESATSTADSVSTAVQAIASFSWSPDSTLLTLNTFQGGYYVWNLETNEVGTPVPGRAIAVTEDLVAAWGAEGLELRDRTGRVMRRWIDLSAPVETPVLEEGAFDPQQRYLVVRGIVGPPGEDGQDGLTVLSTIGTTRRVLTTDPREGFAWSGDGNGLYWLDSQGLHVWSADPERASTTLVEATGDQAFNRLRVYDPATSPVRHPQLATSTLVERRSGNLQIRSLDGLAGPDFEEDLRSIIPAGVPGYFLSVGYGEEELPVTLANPDQPESAQILGTLNSLQLPEGARIVKAIALTPDYDETLTRAELEATRWYLETDDGSILHGPEANLFTTAAEGSSLNLLGGTAFYVTADGSAIQTIPVGTGIDTVLTAGDLGAERILAVGTVRRALFVLVSTAGGEIHLWQVPGDSPRLTAPLFPPAPAMTAEAWIVHTFPEPATGAWILMDPDAGPTGELLVARVDGPEGPVTVAIAAPLALESVCGASAGGACVLFSVPGEPLGFSPDGNWLLIRSGGTYLALSTVGRGSFGFAEPSPDDVAWVESRP